MIPSPHLMFLQDSPHCLLPLHLLLPPQVEDQQGQQDEEEHHPTHCSSNGCTRSEHKEIVQFLFLKNNLHRHHFSIWTVNSPCPDINGAASLIHHSAAKIEKQFVKKFSLCAQYTAYSISGFVIYIHSRQSAVGVAGQTVFCSIAVLPHSLLILLDTAGTMIYTELTVLVIFTLCAMFCTLETQIEQYLSTVIHILSTST